MAQRSEVWSRILAGEFPTFVLNGSSFTACISSGPFPRHKIISTVLNDPTVTVTKPGVTTDVTGSILGNIPLFRGDFPIFTGIPHRLGGMWARDSKHHSTLGIGCEYNGSDLDGEDANNLACLEGYVTLWEWPSRGRGSEWVGIKRRGSRQGLRI